MPADTATGVGVFLVEPGDGGRDGHRADVLGPRRGRPARPRRRARRPRRAGRRGRRRPRTPGSGTCCCWPRPPSSSASARARSRSPRRTRRRASSSAARSAPSRRSRSGWPTATSTCSAQRLTLWQAAWRLEEGLPADTEVAIAKLWAADAGHRIAHTTVHVHGGVGIDLDGEAHRYFTSAKRYEFLHGGATEQALARRPHARRRAGLTWPRPSQQLLRARAADDHAGLAVRGPHVDLARARRRGRRAASAVSRLLDPDAPAPRRACCSTTPRRCCGSMAAAGARRLRAGRAQHHPARRRRSPPTSAAPTARSWSPTPSTPPLLDGLDLGVPVLDVDSAEWASCSRPRGAPGAARRGRRRRHCSC